MRDLLIQWLTAVCVFLASTTAAAVALAGYCVREMRAAWREHRSEIERRK